jgi:hypothetical protein
LYGRILNNRYPRLLGSDINEDFFIHAN